MDNGFVPENWIAPSYTSQDSDKAFKDLLDSEFDLRVDVLRLLDLIETKDLKGKSFKNKFTSQKVKEILSN